MASALPPDAERTVSAKLYYCLESGGGLLAAVAGSFLRERVTLQLFSANKGSGLPDMTNSVKLGSRLEVDDTMDDANQLGPVYSAVSGLNRGKLCLAKATIEVPAGFGSVGGALLRLESDGAGDNEVYLAGLQLQTGKEEPVFIPCMTHIHEKHGARVFFAATLLPSQTPAPLAVLRERELQILRGERRDLLSSAALQEITEEPKVWDRCYQYAVYNDLSRTYKDPSDKAPSKPDSLRPTLGGPQLPYPRRCRTGRKLNPDNTEGAGKGFWVPQDESFDNERTRGFSLTAVREVLTAARQALGELVGDDSWDSFQQVVDQMYVGDSDGRIDEFTDLLDFLLRMNHVPRVIKGRPDEWRTDEEFGRQVLAGVNPMSIQVARRELLSTTAFTDSSVDASLTGGQPLSALLEAAEAGAYRRPVLFVIDHHALFVEYAKRVNNNKEQDSQMYGARCLLHLGENDVLLPVAVELTDPTQEPETRVFTPRDPPGVWLLAKAVFGANDAGAHQLVSHWLRTHACMEPFIMATRRHLSAAHPLYKLLLPHTRATMQINSQARSSLVNAGGVIERTFSPGPWSMELSAKVYAATWRFDSQGLPADLLARGMAYRDEQGALQLVVKDYPYAADGLLIWDALQTWVAEYCGLYYADDGAVQEDVELQAWWADARGKGHPDKPDGWPALDGAAALVHILTTIVWLASAHHAAVNFGQYDFAGFMPNKSTQIRKPGMPLKGSREWKKLASDDEKEMQAAFLEVVASRLSAATVALTINILSTHFPDEKYLDDEVHPFLQDAAALEAYQRLRQRLAAASGTIASRNADQSLRNRCKGPAERSSGPLEYTLLSPDSEPGVTMRGIPTSISI